MLSGFTVGGLCPRPLEWVVIARIRQPENVDLEKLAIPECNGLPSNTANQVLRAKRFHSAACRLTPRATAM